MQGAYSKSQRAYAQVMRAGGDLTEHVAAHGIGQRAPLIVRHHHHGAGERLFRLGVAHDTRHGGAARLQLCGNDHNVKERDEHANSCQ